MPEGAGAGAAAGGTPGSDGTSGQPASQGQQQQQQSQSTGQNGAAGQQPQGDGTSTQQRDPNDVAGLKSALASERSEREAMAKRLKALEEKDLPEAERVKRQRDELEAADKTKATRIRELSTQNTAIRTAIRLGFSDPDDALGFLALNADRVTYDGDTPSNLESLLKDLLKAKPHLKTGGQADPGSADGGARGGAPVSMSDRIRQAARGG